MNLVWSTDTGKSLVFCGDKVLVPATIFFSHLAILLNDPITFKAKTVGKS